MDFKGHCHESEKTTPTEREKIIVRLISDKRLVSIIRKELLELN